MIVGIDASRANKFYKTGTEWYSYHLIQELKKIADPEDQFILYSREPLLGDLEILPNNWKSKILRWPPQKLWTQFRLSWEMLFHSPDILFVPAHVIPVIHPKKTITTCHDVGFLRLPQVYSWLEIKYQRFALNFAIRHAKKIIVVSEFTKKELIELTGISSERMVRVYNGYDRSRYKVIEDQTAIEMVLKKYNLCKPYILYVGRLELKKNTPGLVQAFGILKKNSNLKSQISNLKLVLVGQPGFGFEKIAEAMIENDLHDEVILPGWIDQKDLPFLINGAELFVFPSFYEGFGIPVLEAASCGTPVVASDIEPIRETAGEAVYFVDPWKPEDIASGILRVLDDQSLREELKIRGLAQVEKFSWEKCARETLEVIQQLK
jgi:glycosyltransferase involved in cell wall biosynthesis